MKILKTNQYFVTSVTPQLRLKCYKITISWIYKTHCKV